MTRGQIWQNFPKLLRFMALFPSLPCCGNIKGERKGGYLHPVASPLSLCTVGLATALSHRCNIAVLVEARPNCTPQSHGSTVSALAVAATSWVLFCPTFLSVKKSAFLSRATWLKLSKSESTGTERQKRSRKLAPVQVIISVNSLVFRRKIITSTGFYRCCAPARQHQQW